MAIKNILVSLRGTGKERHVALCGLTLAQHFKAHVTAAASLDDVRRYLDPAGIASVSYYAELQKFVDQERSDRYDRARADFGEAMAVSKVPTVDRPTCHEASAYWLDTSQFTTSAIGMFGRLADLVIVDRPGEIAAGVEDIEEGLFGVRRPLLLLPPSTYRLSKRVAIAWNGSTEAAAAVRHALDLLEPGAKAIIIQVGEIADDATSASELADYLGWHCFETEIRMVEDQPQATSRLILNAAHSAGADLLVMGAYSHSRLREIFFGGVTAHMLRHCDLPVLMSH